MRIVVDTNVLLAAVLGTGSASAVIASCLNGKCVPLLGNALFREYEDVFGRTALFGKSRLEAHEREELLDIFFACCEWTRVYYLWRPNLKDEADNHLVELAVAGGANFIVTRNLRDLQSAELKFGGFKAVSPDRLLKEI